LNEKPWEPSHVEIIQVDGGSMFDDRHNNRPMPGSGPSQWQRYREALVRKLPSHRERPDKRHRPGVAFHLSRENADFDQNRLAFLLLMPHPNMPNMSLNRAEISDLADYIRSLK
jgi:hypothetical protein